MGNFGYIYGPAMEEYDLRVEHHQYGVSFVVMKNSGFILMFF